MNEGFLERLFAKITADPFDESWWSGFAIEHTSGERRVLWAGRPRDLEAQLLALGPSWHAYYALATRTHKLPNGQRGGAGDCGAITALWIDIDIKGPAHKIENLPPDMESANELLASHPQPPSLVIETGGGLQAIWLLDTPVAAEPARALLDEWNASWQERARLKGWHLDNTSDLPRVLRMPGTWNPKFDPPRATQIRGDCGWQRYTVDELQEYLLIPAQPEPEPRQPTLRIAGEETPGDWFNRTQEIGELLTRAGFVFDHEANGQRHFRAPHRFEERGAVGATVWTDPSDPHVAFWSETWCAANPQFRVKQSYDAFGVFARLRANGDFIAATRVAASMRAVAEGPPPQRPGPKPKPEPELERSIERHPSGPPADVPVNLEAVALAAEPETNVVELDLSGRFFTAKGGFLPETMRQAIVAEFPPIVVGPKRMLMHYADGVYHLDEEPGVGPINAYCQALLGERWTAARVDTMVRMIRGSTETPRFDDSSAERWINCPNGLLDWRTGELHPHTPDVHSIVQIATPWEPGALCSGFIAWLHQVLDPQVHPLIFEMIGACLYAGIPVHKAFVLFGPPRKGKSTLLRLIERVLGIENCSAVDLQDLSDDRFATASLYGKLANISGDLPRKAILNSSQFLGLTGGDAIEVQRKGGHRFVMQSMAQLVFSTNVLPPISDYSGGFHSRLHVVEFTKLKMEVPDQSVEDALYAELPGIMVQAVEGLRRVKVNKAYSLDERTAAATQAYKDESNPVSRFVEERVEETGEFIASRSSTEIYRAYLYWCDGLRRHPLSDTAFWPAMEAVLGEKMQRPPNPVWIDGRKMRAVRGIKLN